MHVGGDGKEFRYVISHPLMGSLSLLHEWWYLTIVDVGGEKRARGSIFQNHVVSIKGNMVIWNQRLTIWCCVGPLFKSNVMPQGG